MVNISIPIPNHDDQCVQYYTVQYKLSSEAGYVTLPYQFSSPITINNLLEGSEYNIRITRSCCDGLVSPPLDITVNTGLAAPTNFVATGGNTEVTLTWDDMTNATNYIIERDENNAFPSPVEVYNGGYVASYDDEALVNGTTYYYRIKSQAVGYADSDYSYDDATPSS